MKQSSIIYVQTVERNLVSKLHVPIKRTREWVELPEYATPQSAGFDIATAEECRLIKGQFTYIKTGIVVKTPVNHMLMLVPRSSTYRKYGITMPHSVGIVDEDYCGPEDELLLQVTATMDTTIPPNTRIAQGIFIPITRAEFDENTAVAALSRGGFGSSG